MKNQSNFNFCDGRKFSTSTPNPKPQTPNLKPLTVLRSYSSASSLLRALTLFFLLPFLVSAQVSHEISLAGGGGLGTFNYKLSKGKKSLGFGGDAGIGYTCMFTKMAGIHIGAEIAFYNSNATLNGVKVITNHLTDNEGDRFNMHTTLGNYKESQNAMFLNIPVMFQLQVGKTHKFYALGGVKLGVPVSCKYKVSGATFTNEGYYPESDNWLKTQEFAGFGTFKKRNSDGKLPLSISVAIALEAGMKWSIGKMFAIYTGAYFDYGLNSVSKKKEFIKVNYFDKKPAEFKTTSAIPALGSKMNVMAVGVKVRLALLPNGNNEVAEKQKDNTLKPDSKKAPSVAEKQKAEKPKKKAKVEVEAPQEKIVEKPVEKPAEPVKPVEVALTAASEFVLGRPARTGFPATAMGITWISNIDASTAKFTTAPNALVILPDQAAYQAITTQEKLREAFDSGKKASEFFAKAATNFKPQYFIVQDGETLRLVEMTYFLIKSGESKATFTEKR